ncbi:MAG TPA: MmgE/PrpD family protein, partial [Fodinibius sp.]|nr:MmgE/PrpD family protein [Fodinibius sp.]
MIVHDLAKFINDATYNDLTKEAVKQLKIRLLDSLGTAIGAIEGPPVQAIRNMIDDVGGAGQSTLIGDGKTTPDRAALYNSGLVRYLDFNDSYLAKGETCHPSDNIGSILAAGETTELSGKDFLTALAIAYQVQCRLSDEAPVRHKGFDHTTQGSYAVAAGVSKAFGLDQIKTANAIAIAGTALNALRVTRTGALSNWKGLAYPHTAFGGTHAVLLAKYGITGPPAVFEGNKGFMDSIAGEFEIDWSAEDLERVRNTIIKKYNAE